ncbi:28 kDa heat- and acid-stable phosphoprotein isoform 1-T1 [Ciconia maguari]
MPKGGRKGGHKGRARQYTSPEEIDAQLQAEKQKAREEEEQEEGGEGATGDPKKEKKSLDSDESDEDDEDYQQKRKGVEGLIDIENPNRVIQTTKKVTQLDLDGPKELSRRERSCLSSGSSCGHPGARRLGQRGNRETEGKRKIHENAPSWQNRTSEGRSRPTSHHSEAKGRSCQKERRRKKSKRRSGHGR